MDEQRAQELLSRERRRVEAEIRDMTLAGQENRSSADATGDMADVAEPLTEEQAADAIARGLRARLDAIERAEARLRDGTYGRSTLSGEPIPDERLEADPAAALTAEEAADQERPPLV